jgi:hypothetical protein
VSLAINFRARHHCVSVDSSLELFDVVLDPNPPVSFIDSAVLAQLPLMQSFGLDTMRQK